MGGGRRCVVLDCDNNYSDTRKEKVSYHEIPSDEKQRKLWLKQLKPYMDPYCRKQLFHICGDHFEEKYFLRSKRRILIRGAIPTLFNTKESNMTVTTDYLKENGNLTRSGRTDGPEEGENVDEEEDAISSEEPQTSRMEDHGETDGKNQSKYLFNSVKVYKEGGRGEICRVCFTAASRYKNLNDKHVSRAQTYKEIMKSLSLDINYDFYPDPVICSSCVVLLLNAYDLKRKCDKTERSLQKYYTNRMSTDHPTNLLIIAYRRKKKEPTSGDITFELNEVESTAGETDTALAEHDYDATPVPTTKVEAQEEYEEEIKLSIENDDNEDDSTQPPVTVKQEPEEEDLPQQPKYKRITIWGDPPYLCDMCGRMFQNKRQCRRHLRMHRIKNETVESYFCEICECAYSNVNVAMHMDTHRKKRYQCSVCGRQFDKINLLLNHVQGAHEKEPFVDCDVCGKRCTRKQLSAHVQRHHDTKDASCLVCGRVVYRLRLRQHIRAHCQAKSRSVCHVCGKSVIDYLMGNHVRRHSETPKYRCEVCEIAFFTEKELQLHSGRKKHVRNLMLYEVTRKERCAKEAKEQS